MWILEIDQFSGNSGKKIFSDLISFESLRGRKINPATRATVAFGTEAELIKLNSEQTWNSRDSFLTE